MGGPIILRSFYFTENFWLPKFENRIYRYVTVNFSHSENGITGTEKQLRKMQPQFPKFGNQNFWWNRRFHKFIL